MNDEQILGLVLFLLHRSMKFDYTEEQIKSWSIWRNLLELARIIVDFLCFVGAFKLLILPALLAVFE